MGSGGGVLATQEFLDGILFAKVFSLAPVVLRWRPSEMLPRLDPGGFFAKVLSNPGVVVPGSLLPGEFGSVCKVLCELSRQSNYLETIPHVETLYICHFVWLKWIETCIPNTLI